MSPSRPSPSAPGSPLFQERTQLVALTGFVREDGSQNTSLRRPGGAAA
ncbi:MULTISPECIES: hypothetical protein [unclassified Kitasatospora]